MAPVCLVGRGVVPVVMDEMGAGRVGSDDAGRHCRTRAVEFSDSAVATAVARRRRQGSDTPSCITRVHTDMTSRTAPLVSSRSSPGARCNSCGPTSMTSSGGSAGPGRDGRGSLTVVVARSRRGIVDNPIGRQRRAGRFVHRTDDGIIHGVASVECMELRYPMISAS